MKKFLGNLWVMVASLVLFVLTSSSLIFVLSQPLFCMGNYYSNVEYESPTGEIYIGEAWINIDLNNTLEMKQIVTNQETGKTEEQTTGYWYYRDGKTLFQIGNTKEMTKEEYKEAVKTIQDMSAKEYKAYKDEMGYVITFKAFYLSNESSIRQNSLSKAFHLLYINKSKVPTIITLSVVDTVLLAFATTSVVCFILNKKSKKEEPAVVEETSEDTAA